MDDISVRVLIISDLFERYTVVVSPATNDTSVYCEQCEQWVAQYDGDCLSQYTQTEFYAEIVDSHKQQVLGKPVEFDDSII